MSHRKDIGRKGELTAKSFLIKKGYEVLEMNWRFSKAEIDIICKKEDIYIFVEVKTRSSEGFGSPDSFVTAAQEKMIADAANEYMKMVGHEWEFRFDIIGIVIRGGLALKIEHFEDAFFPGL